MSRYHHVDELMCVFVLDINECTDGTHNCSVNGLCTNVIGTYRCECRQGWRGNGLECSGKVSCSLNFCFLMIFISRQQMCNNIGNYPLKATATACFFLFQSIALSSSQSDFCLAWCHFSQSLHLTLQAVNYIITIINLISFRELMQMVTLGVGFSFDDLMFCQTNGIAKGSPQVLRLQTYLSGTMKSVYQIIISGMHSKYVDDVFSHFENKERSVRFGQRLNSLHPATLHVRG